MTTVRVEGLRFRTSPVSTATWPQASRARASPSGSKRQREVCPYSFAGQAEIFQISVEMAVWMGQVLSVIVGHVAQRLCVYVAFLDERLIDIGLPAFGGLRVCWIARKFEASKLESLLSLSGCEWYT